MIGLIAGFVCFNATHALKHALKIDDSLDEAPAANARGIVYEVGLEGDVSQIHAGGPSIQYVEGCL